MTYAEKLKDPRWQKKRLEILNAANWICVSCGGASKTLHVHHKRYISGQNPWDYDEEDLECLCEDCHERISAIDKDLRQSIQRLNEAQKLSCCGYVYAQNLFDEYHATGMNLLVSVLYSAEPEWLEGFANFFGLGEKDLYLLQDDHCGLIQFKKLEAAWEAKETRGVV